MEAVRYLYLTDSLHVGIASQINRELLDHKQMFKSHICVDDEWYWRITPAGNRQIRKSKMFLGNKFFARNLQSQQKGLDG